MVQSDALSCRPDHIIDDNDNDNIILLPDNLFVRNIDLDLRDTLTDLTFKDVLFTKALEALQNNGPLPITSKLADWHFDNGLLFFKDRCYIPPDLPLQRGIVSRYHDSLSGGHPGHLKTLELIQRHYWWPGLTVFIWNYVAGCLSTNEDQYSSLGPRFGSHQSTAWHSSFLPGYL